MKLLEAPLLFAITYKCCYRAYSWLNILLWQHYTWVTSTMRTANFWLTNATDVWFMISMISRLSFLLAISTGVSSCCSEKNSTVYCINLTYNWQESYKAFYLQAINWFYTQYVTFDGILTWYDNKFHKFSTIELLQNNECIMSSCCSFYYNTILYRFLGIKRQLCIIILWYKITLQFDIKVFINLSSHLAGHFITPTAMPSAPLSWHLHC